MFCAQRRAVHHGYTESSGVAQTIRRRSDAYHVPGSLLRAERTVTTAYGASSLHQDGVQNSKSSPAPNAAFSAFTAFVVRSIVPASVATASPFTYTRPKRSTPFQE
ncbi:MAG: hypothetical protein E6I94_04780 [Chloroflexi bacterium]|nr:MAG: hypothetical protein E6I94_04780 [Chloroflexota bacterium]